MCHIKHEVIIALGSNMGDRLSYIQKAKSYAASLYTTVVSAYSSIYESDPIGSADAPFLNAIIQIFTQQNPITLLKLLKQFEAESGRDLNAPTWSNRPIDLDIISYHNWYINLPDLIVPHIHYAKRLFVLLPLEEIKPDWRDPLSGRSISELITTADSLQISRSINQW